MASKIFLIMKRMLWLMAASVLAFAACEDVKESGGASSSGDGSTLEILWEEPQQVTVGSSKVTGGYPRVHRLNDGRLMMSYSYKYMACALFSKDNGKTWDNPQEVMPKIDVSNGSKNAVLTAAVPEFAQLSENNPHHPGRIIYTCNYRPRSTDGKTTGMTTVHPYTIAVSVSDDNGKTWKDQGHVYKSGLWTTNVTVGCWEPFVLELPDGTVQIYFADETPYYALGSKRHNISLIESKDGGDTWSQAKVITQNGDNRDGMPVVTLHEDKILLAIESTDGVHKRLHPIVVCSPIEDNWSSVVGNGSPYRFHPFEKSIKSSVVYSGAPYIITTDNYIVYSYQISDWYDAKTLSEAKAKNNEEHSTLEVQVCPKSEVKDGFFHTMRAPSRPIKLDQSKEQAIWNSLCDLGNDEVMAVSQYNNKVYIVRGKIVMK